MRKVIPFLSSVADYGCGDSPSASVSGSVRQRKAVGSYGHVVWALQLVRAQSTDAPGSRAPARSHNADAVSHPRYRQRTQRASGEFIPVWRLTSGRRSLVYTN